MSQNQLPCPDDQVTQSVPENQVSEMPSKTNKFTIKTFTTTDAALEEARCEVKRCSDNITKLLALLELRQKTTTDHFSNCPEDFTCAKNQLNNTLNNIITKVKTLSKNLGLLDRNLFGISANEDRQQDLDMETQIEVGRHRVYSSFKSVEEKLDGVCASLREEARQAGEEEFDCDLFRKIVMVGRMSYDKGT
ncbi:MAG: hypothetical protein Q9186_000115 [Xanthomendoza sp. 1 TL-2023]